MNFEQRYKALLDALKRSSDETRQEIIENLET